MLRRMNTSLLPKWGRRLRARLIEEIPIDHIRSYQTLGFWYALSLARARNSRERLSCYVSFSKAFNKLVVDNGLREGDAVYVYNEAGLEILRTARMQGKFCILDQTIVPSRVERAILREESDRNPEWVETVDDFYVQSILDERAQAEWSLADVVLCGSEFVRSALCREGVGSKKCIVVPYGFDGRVGGARSGVTRKGVPLRVLFVGAVCLRKGAPYIYRVAKRLQRIAEFRLIGAVDLPQKARALLGSVAEMRGIVSRGEVSEHLDWADVFFFPSLAEGSAGVVYEALAAGLPVVTTPNSGSIVRDGVDGFVVPLRDVDSMVCRLEQLAEDRGLVRCMSDSAKARSCFGSIDAYGSRLVQALYERLAEL